MWADILLALLEWFLFLVEWNKTLQTWKEYKKETLENMILIIFILTFLLEIDVYNNRASF